MTDDPRPQSDFKKEFYELRGEAIEIRRRLTKIDGKESKVVWFVGIMAALLTITIPSLTLVYNGINAKQYADAIDRSEKQMALLSGLLRPETAWVHGVHGEDDDSITMAATILPQKIESVRYFTVSLRGVALVSVKGGNGSVIGYQSSSFGPVAEFSSRRFDGTIMDYMMLSESRGQYDNENFFGGRIVSEGAPLAVTISRNSNYSTCEEAERALADLLSIDEAGSFGLIPMFTNIAEPVATPYMLKAKVVKGNNPDCAVMAQMESWQFETRGDETSASNKPTIPGSNVLKSNPADF